MKKIVTAVVVLGAAVALYQAAALANGSTLPSGAGSAPSRSPEEMAIEAYNSGINHKDKGLQFEATSQVTTDAKERAKLQNKAKQEFEKALKDFRNAASGSPKMYQAYNGMGFAYRKTGDHAKALEMYDKALALAPGFPDAIEYRGEAYLGLNRVDDAKQAYLEILAADRKQADTLLAAMKAWLEQRKANPAGVDPAIITGLETWINERSEIAKETAAMGLTHGPRW